MSAKLKEVVLHIGHQKTGSTSLQKSLYAARADLRSQGILLPDTFGNSGIATLLGHHLFGPDLLTRHRESWMKLTPEAASQQARKQWQSIKTDLATGNARKLIISSEHLFKPFDMASLAQGKAMLGEIADRIRVVVYVRSPAPASLSMLQEMLKTFQVDVRYRKKEYVRDTLRNWVDVFGDALEVLPFDKQQLVGGDIVADFHARYLQELDISLPSGDFTALNSSVSAEVMAIMYDVARRNVHPKFQTGTAMKLARANDRLVPHPTRPKLNYAAHASLNNWFAADIRWLHDRYGICFSDAPLAQLDERDIDMDLVHPARIEDICAVNAERKEKLWQRIRWKHPLPQLLRRWAARW